ncbi:MAG TPA: lactaldehyde reductase [Candidatus Faecisoma merdavium]|nr:lactaldehyde reductase [Candidatus Faecisoma merdavium]
MINRIILNETSYFGYGSRSVLKDEIKKRGYKKALIVTQENILKNVTDKVLEVLDGFDYELFMEIKPNPTIKNVKDGVSRCKEINADYIIAIGGGSVIDTAKAIGIIMTNPEFSNVVSLDGTAETKNKSLPIIAIPTTAGTAAEVTINYVITDEERVKKMVCVDPHDVPVLSIIDQELMMEMPKMVAASTGMDALTHAIEGFTTKAAWEMTDMFHLEAIKLIFNSIEKAVNEKDKKAIENVGLGQYIAGMGFSNVGLGLVHAMAHPLGALYDTPHGIANAVILPYVIEYNSNVCYDKLKEIAKAMNLEVDNLSNEEVASSIVNSIKEMNKKLGIPSSLKELNVSLKDIDWLANAAYNDICLGGNSKEASVEDIKKIYERIYEGI